MTQCACECTIYQDDEGVWRHRTTDSTFCHPNLAYLDAFGAEAHPRVTAPNPPVLQWSPNTQPMHRKESQ